MTVATEQPFSVRITAASRRAEIPRQTDSLQKHNLPRRNCGELVSYIQRCPVQVNRLWRRTRMRSNANRAVAAVTAAAIALTTAGVAPAFAASRKAPTAQAAATDISSGTAIIGQPPRLPQRRRCRGGLRAPSSAASRPTRPRANIASRASAAITTATTAITAITAAAARLLRRRHGGYYGNW